MFEKTSPLAAVLEPGTFGREANSPGVLLQEREIISLVQLTHWADTAKAAEKVVKSICKLNLPAGYSTAENENHCILPIGPGRYLIEGEDAGLEASLRKKIADATGSITGLSHGRIVIQISGSRATWVLAKGFALDFHLDGFPVGTAQASNHHDIGVTIRRIDEETFELYVMTSFARSFWHWLTSAAAEVGYEVR